MRDATDPLLSLGRYVMRVLLGLDQLVNALLGGYPTETISWRAAFANARGEWWGCVLCKIVERWLPRHCDLSLPSKSERLGRGSK